MTNATVRISFLYSDPNYRRPPSVVQKWWRSILKDESLKDYIENTIKHMTNGESMQKYSSLVSNIKGNRFVIYRNHPENPELGEDAQDFVNALKTENDITMFNF